MFIRYMLIGSKKLIVDLCLPDMLFGPKKLIVDLSLPNILPGSKKLIVDICLPDMLLDQLSTYVYQICYLFLRR